MDLFWMSHPMLHFIQWTLSVTCFVYPSCYPALMFSSTHSENIYTVALGWTSSVMSMSFLLWHVTLCAYTGAPKIVRKCVTVKKSVFLFSHEPKYAFWSASCIKLLLRCNIGFFESKHKFRWKEEKVTETTLS